MLCVCGKFKILLHTFCYVFLCVVLQTLPLPNGSVSKRNTDGGLFGTAPRVSADRTKTSRSLGGSLRRVCSSGGASGGLGDGHSIGSSKGGSGSLVGAVGSGSLRETASSTPASATPVSCRRATANHRAATVVTTAGPPPRYHVSEYTFEREHPDSPFSDEKDSNEKKKGECGALGTVRGKTATGVARGGAGRHVPRPR